jgi:perosamine synthetase
MVENSKKIPLSIPCLQGNEWKYIKDCLDSNWVSSVGSYVNRFEDELADYIGTEHAVAMVNGTAAIHIALLISGIRQDDEVIVPALTFVSPVNCIRYVGAHPVFMDVEPDFWQMDTAKLAEFLEKECVWKNRALYNKHTNRRVAGILPVDLLGHPSDIDAILELAEKYGLKVIEDATESLGAEYKQSKVGSKAPVACFSFNGNKIITTGGGGMLVTNIAEFAEKARYLSQQAKDDPLEYIHNEIGYNYRMTNLQAAMGCAQLEVLDCYVTKKCRIASTYTSFLDEIPGIHCPSEAAWAHSTFWLYTILVNHQKYGASSRGLMRKLFARQVITRPLWCPVYRLPPFIEEYAYRISHSDHLYDCALSLPSSVGITVEELIQVVDLLKEFQGGVDK